MAERDALIASGSYSVPSDDRQFTIAMTLYTAPEHDFQGPGTAFERLPLDFGLLNEYFLIHTNFFKLEVGTEHLAI
jgi:hypothetical protein